jgi:hypothetical protein
LAFLNNKTSINGRLLPPFPKGGQGGLMGA